MRAAALDWQALNDPAVISAVRQYFDMSSVVKASVFPGSCLTLIEEMRMSSLQYQLEVRCGLYRLYRLWLIIGLGKLPSRIVYCVALAVAWPRLMHSQALNAAWRGCCMALNVAWRGWCMALNVA